MKKKYNQKIRKLIADSNIYLFELSTQIGIAESTLFYWLRHPLDSEHEEILINAVESLKLRKSEG